MTSPTIQRATKAFREKGGTLRTSEAIAAGIHPRTLYQMRDAGLLVKLSRGLYRLSDLPPLGNPDLALVAAKVPHGVICLISALAYYELTTQIPHQVYLALKRGSEPPRLDNPPLRLFWFSRSMFEAGIEHHAVDGFKLQVYGPAKTMADCFRYRNKLGLDVPLEALRLYRERSSFDIEEILHYARICRVEQVMRPYLEAIL
ncbi:MAG: type IV toxin-antitoxin system AbiEi family antitoxin domain-containing protein [Thermoleophilia bacterium]|nr:type IV toxin-antitoxin system AbiEi family antitoxin domain-containing protein [Thermoleophilia bacterium]